MTGTDLAKIVDEALQQLERNLTPKLDEAIRKTEAAYDLPGLQAATVEALKAIREHLRESGL